MRPNIVQLLITLFAAYLRWNSWTKVVLLHAINSPVYWRILLENHTLLWF
jgi:hypothetical protein